MNFDAEQCLVGTQLRKFGWIGAKNVKNTSKKKSKNSKKKFFKNYFLIDYYDYGEMVDTFGVVKNHF